MVRLLLRNSIGVVVIGWGEENNGITNLVGPERLVYRQGVDREW